MKAVVPFHVVPHDEVACLVMVAAMREGGDDAIAEQYGLSPGRIANLRTTAALHLARFDALTASARRVAAFDAKAISDGDVHQRRSLSFAIGDDVSLEVYESAGSTGVVRGMRLRTSDGDTTITFGAMTQRDRILTHRNLLPAARSAVGRMADHTQAVIDRLLGRNGAPIAPRVPHEVAEAAEACIRIVGDRTRMPGTGERSGQHTFATPWSTARTVVDDVARTSSPAEAAWLPHAAIASLRCATDVRGPIRITMEPLRIRTHFTPADAMQHMRSIAAVSVFRPHDD